MNFENGVTFDLNVKTSDNMTAASLASLLKAGVMYRGMNATPTEKLALESMTVDNQHDLLQMHFKTDDQRFQALLKSDLFASVVSLIQVDHERVAAVDGGLASDQNRFDLPNFRPGKFILHDAVLVRADAAREFRVAQVKRGTATLLVMPFENRSKAAGSEWFSEACSEVLVQRMASPAACTWSTATSGYIRLTMPACRSP